MENNRKNLKAPSLRFYTHRILNRQSNLCFDEKCAELEKTNSYSFKWGSIQYIEPTYDGFCVLDLSQLKLFAWFYNKMQPNLGADTLESHFMDTDSIHISIKRIKGLFEDLKQFEKKTFWFQWVGPRWNDSEA